MSTFSFKKFLSFILSISIAMSFIILLPSTVNADNLLQINTLYNLDLTGSRNIHNGREYLFEFVPVESGYYRIESTFGVETVGENEDGFYYLEESGDYNYFNSPDFLDAHLFSVYYYQYTFEAGKHYYFSDYKDYTDGQFAIKKIDEYISFYPVIKDIQAKKDATFTCEVGMESSIDYELNYVRWINCQDYSFISDNDASTIFSITLNSNDYIDFDDPNRDYNNSLIFEISYIYEDEIYYNDVFFNLIPSEPFEDTVHADLVHQSNGWFIYQKDYSYNSYYKSQYFEVKTNCDLDTEISITYQWYKIDSNLECEGITDKSKLYIPLEGETSSQFYICNDTDEPYVYVIDNQFYIVKKYICEVTFDNGDEIVKKEILCQVYYHAQVDYQYYDDPTISVIYGDDITFTVDDYFVTTSLPNEVSFKYLWINLKNLSAENTQSTHTCSTRSIWEGKMHGEKYAILSNDDSITINSSDLIWFEENGEKVSYVVCISEPLYKGNPIYGFSLANGYQVFKIVEDNNDNLIVSQPEDYYASVGNTAVFSVGTRGEGLKYQWQVFKNGVWKTTYLTGCNTPSLSVGVTDARDGMKFRCVVTDNDGNTEISEEATLYVIKQGPEIINQPSDFKGPVGETAVFTVDAEGDGLTYQWQVYKNGVWKNTSLTGNTTNTLYVGVIESRNGMKFRCVIYDWIGFKAESSEVTITVASAGPEIISQPEDYTGAVGETATFSVEAEGNALTYQWQVFKSGAWKNTSLPGCTSSSLDVEITSARDGMTFRCVIKDSKNNKVISDEVMISVDKGPVIISQPEDYTGAVGETAEFSVEVKGSALTYQWQVYKNGAWKNTSLAGNTTDTLEVGIIESRDGMQFRCVIKDGNNNKVISDEVTVSIWLYS